ISFHNIDKQVAQSNPDCIEILPGCMPKVLGWVTEKIRQPLIANNVLPDDPAYGSGLGTCRPDKTRQASHQALNVGCGVRPTNQTKFNWLRLSRQSNFFANVQTPVFV
ncbi:glycerol-3-phosphate responsive antiterminator, partial [Escherichia coli]|uniref:glycerol-3-phosphate responsive antiterminator n=1 Tax=Escherichia coli TaxID=562 RepID=UPI0015931EC7